MRSLEEENESWRNEITKSKAEYCSVLQDLEEKKSEIESSLRGKEVVDTENHRLQDDIFSLQNSVSNLQTVLDTVNVELNQLRLRESELKDALSSKTHDLQIYVDETLDVQRQKEIFMLNARLATAESMTHDVIHDLLGQKSDVNGYASLLDNQQVQKITEKARLHSAEVKIQDQEIIKLKQQLSEFVKERKGWLEEIDRKQAEMVATQIALEEFCQRDQLLTTENEMFKMESANNKKKVMELEAEVKKLSGQQNVQQRIHHRAKIKSMKQEENNLQKAQNEDLSSKLRRSETILSRVKEELAHFRATNGRSPCIHFDEEQRLNERLKETEEERLQLAQKLLGLCTNILKTAGITRPTSDISLSVAEEALEQLKDRANILNRELQEVKLKNRITNERNRLSELMPQMQSSPLSSRAEGSCQSTPNRLSQTPFSFFLDR